jgi:hypothetical protein
LKHLIGEVSPATLALYQSGPIFRLGFCRKIAELAVGMALTAKQGVYLSLPSEPLGQLSESRRPDTNKVSNLFMY